MKNRHWLIFAVSFFVGLFLIYRQDKLFVQQKNQKLTSFIDVVSAAINPDRILSLSATPSDLQNPDYLRLQDQLTRLGSVDPDIRYLYVMGMRQDQVFFYLDTQPEKYNNDPRPLAAPGEVYQEADSDLRSVFYKAKQIIVGPEADKWGNFISVLSPVTDFQDGRTIALVGADVYVDNWQQQRYRHVVQNSVILFLVLIVQATALSYFSQLMFQQKTHYFYAAAFESASVPIVFISTLGKVLGQNKSSKNIFGNKLSPLVVIDPLKSAIDSALNLRRPTSGRINLNNTTYIFQSAPTIDNQENILGVGILFLDISNELEQLKTQENQINQLQKMNTLMANHNQTVSRLKKQLSQLQTNNDQTK